MALPEHSLLTCAAGGAAVSTAIALAFRAVKQALATLREQRVPNVIWIVGPDKCGKTNIAHALAKRYGLRYFKPSSERATFTLRESDFSAQTKWCAPREIDMCSALGLRVIFDRGWPCEFAYGHVRGRHFNIDDIVAIDKLAAEAGGAVVVCYRSCYDGLVDDLDPKLGPEELAQLERAYRALAKRSRTPFVFVNVDDENVDRELRDIENALACKRS